MNIELAKDNYDAVASELLAVNVFEEDIRDQSISNEIIENLDKKYNGLISAGIKRKALSGKMAEQLFIPSDKQSLLLIGCGKLEEYTVELMKQFPAMALKAAKANGFAEFAIYVRGLEKIQKKFAFIPEGLYVGDYSFDLCKSEDDKDKKTEIEKVLIVNEGNFDENQNWVKQGIAIGQSVNFARDLINRPGNYCTPTILSEQAIEFAKGTKLDIKVLDKKEIEDLKMGSFLSVAAGSEEPPKFIIMHHKPSTKKSDEKIALVGKGVTFDTGGISLKPSANMDEMKGDMSGSAAVIAAMAAISKLDLPVEVLGLVPTTENMPSGKATKPGDVVTASNGKTIEVLNTDAEGRLILADALCYAVNEKATKIIDVATLTGACVVALGEITTGLMTNNQGFADDFMKTCGETGEKIWQLPLFKEYHEQLKSETADLANIGGKWGGTITAACFLENFVDKTPWLHLDIAGTNWASSNGNYFIKGGTGVMVSSFVNYVQSLAK